MRCLQDLGWTVAANDALNCLKNAFPDHSTGTTFKNLEKEVQTSLALLEQTATNQQSSVVTANVTDTINPPDEEQEELLNGTSNT